MPLGVWKLHCRPDRVLSRNPVPVPTGGSVDAAEGQSPLAPDASPAGQGQPAGKPDDRGARQGGGDRGRRPQRGEQRERPPRRRRPTAAERHRRIFFARLTELRRGGDPAAPAPGTAAPAADPTADAPTDEAPTSDAAPVEVAPVEVASTEAAPTDPVADASTDMPATDTAPAPDAPAGDGPPAADTAAGNGTGQAADAAPRRSTAPAAPKTQARLAALIARVGGPETVRAALAPKQDEKGQPLKWAMVCCLAAEGLPPGDPVFLAWVRLAATPVREIKGQVRERDDRGGRGRPGGPRDDRRGRREGGDDRLGAASRADLERLARDGAFRPSVRIVTEGQNDRRERERRKKAERDARLEAERERMRRLGY